jgi:flavin reductase (DIM6/NTAB) family NADH-FMN oxidoreductase RutF
VSILAKDQKDLAQHFAGHPQDGLHVPFVWHECYPLIKGAMAYVTCLVIDMHPAGDHTLYIGQVVHLSSAEEQAPLQYYDGKYL